MPQQSRTRARSSPEPAIVFYDDLGFSTNYAVEDEIEYPGSGDWGMRSFQFEDEGTVPGGPQAIIRPDAAEPWILSTRFGEIGSLYATPDPNFLCIFERFKRVQFVNVLEPERVRDFDVYPVRAGAAVGHGLLLVADWRGLTAIGSDGIRWATENVVPDDLHITPSNGDRIYYSGKAFDGSEVRGALDTATGAILS